MPALGVLPRDGPKLSPTGNESPSPVPRAIQACISCRKQKRRCDKLLPSCSLCSRMTRQCDYTDAQLAPTADDFSALQSRLVELESRLREREKESETTSLSTSGDAVRGTSLNGTAPSNAGQDVPPSSGKGPLWMTGPNKFPSVMFLDFDCFKAAQVLVTKPAVEIPMEVLEILNRGNTVQEAVSEYFNSIHVWFPVVSKKRISLGVHIRDGGPDLAMLFLAMKLVTTRPGNGVGSADDTVYTASKKFIALLESSGAVSLQFLQAMLLVAVHEYGHGIYPAAWMTIAACSRYAEILLLPSFRGSTLVLGACSTWTEAEERRRVWWGIFVIDRTISLGSRKRFCAPQPRETDLLPVDDQVWDEGNMMRANQRPATSHPSEPQGPFARLCQACLLVDRTVNHVDETSRNYSLGVAMPFVLDEVLALHEALLSFASIVRAEVQQSPSSYFSLIPAHSLALSAVIVLLDAYSCPENIRDGLCGSAIGAGRGGSECVAKSADEQAMQEKSIEGLQTTSRTIRDAGLDMLENIMLPTELRQASPLCLDSLYCAMATLHWFWKESRDAEIKMAVEDVKRCLASLGMRWRVATEYLTIERCHDTELSGQWRAIPCA